MTDFNPENTPRKSPVQKANELRLKYPILFNILLIIITGLVVVWILMLFLGNWTLHGQEEEVPDVKGQNIHVALGTLSRSGMQGFITDSIYDNKASAGTVVDQNPKPLSKVKPGRAVYLTIVAYSPKMVTFPNVENTSLRQGQSMIEGLGIRNIIIKRVPSEYDDLVLGAQYNGRTLKGGERIPVNANIILEVGESTDEEFEGYGNPDGGDF